MIRTFHYPFASTLTVTLVAVLFAGVIGCGKPRTAIRIDGSSTVYLITEAVVEEFGAARPNIVATIGVSGTGGGFKKFAAGETDICDASRQITENEKTACAEGGIEYIELEVAYDGIAVVVHPENDWADCLTVDQLKELWRPESAINTWSDLNPNWPDEEINLFGPGTDSGTFDHFTKMITGEEKASRADYTASEDDNVLVRGATSDRYALTYFGYAYYAENKSELKLIGVDAEEGCVTPSQETVLSGAYKPLSRPLYIYVNKAALAHDEVVDFVRFYLKHAEQLAQEVGYIPLSTEARQRNQEIFEAAISE